MNARILMAGESDEPNFAFLAGFERSPDSALLENPVRVVIVNELMELPQIEVVGLQSSKTVFQILLRSRIIALAVLSHEEDLLATVVHRQRLAHNFLGMPIVIIPG